MRDLIERAAITTAAATFLAELIARQALRAPNQTNTMAGVLALALIRDGSLPISALEDHYLSENMAPEQVKLLINIIEDMAQRIEEIEHV